MAYQERICTWSRAAKRAGFGRRATVLGHILLRGSPTVGDREIDKRFGVSTVDMIRDGRLGGMAAPYRNSVEGADLREVVGGLKTADLAHSKAAELFFDKGIRQGI